MTTHATTNIASAANIVKLPNLGIADSGATNRAKHISNAISISFPMVLAAGLLWYFQLSWQPTVFSFAIGTLFFLLSAFSFAIGYHRYFSHRAFKTSAVGTTLMGLFGTWAMHGPILTWAADHRRHHRFADQPHDPHSPYVTTDGPIQNRFKGWFHSHFGWMFTYAATDPKFYAPDLLRDPIVMFFTRHYWAVAATGFILPGVMGWLYGGKEEAVLCIVWGGSARICLLHHLSWMASSFLHMHGDKHEHGKDESRDNTLFGVLLMGEGWHSYHHKFPALAINEPAHLDGCGHVLRIFERLGWAWDLRRAKVLQGAATPKHDLSHTQGVVTI